MSASAHAGASGEAFHTQAFPYASAGASFHAGIASGKFHGVISPTTPRGRRRDMRSERPSPGGYVSPSGSSAAWAWYRTIAAVRPTSPRASTIGFPTSRHTSTASSSASASTRAATRLKASARAWPGAPAQAGATVAAAA